MTGDGGLIIRQKVRKYSVWVNGKNWEKNYKGAKEHIREIGDGLFECTVYLSVC